MSRKRSSPIGESGREWLKEKGLIDNRYKNGFEGMLAKETGKHKRKKK